MLPINSGEESPNTTGQRSPLTGGHPVLPERIRTTETSPVTLKVAGVKRGNLYAVQDQIEEERQPVSL